MAIALLVFWSSCNKYDQATTSYEEKASSSEAERERILSIGGKQLHGLSIVDGVMYFKDPISFVSAFKLISIESEAEYQKFCDINNFESLWLLKRKILLAAEVFGNDGDEQKFHHLFKANHDLFEYNEDTYDFKLQAEFMLKFLPRERIIYIGNSVNYYDELGQIVVESGSRTLLKHTVQNRLSKIEGVHKTTNKFGSNGAFRDCATSVESAWTNNSTGNRRGKVYNTQGYNTAFLGLGLYDYHFFSTFRGRAQKKNLGIWFDYSTDHNMSLSCVARCYTTPSNNTIGTYNINETNLDSDNIPEINFGAYLTTWPSIAYGPTIIPLGNQSNNITYSNQGGVSINFTCN